MEDGGAGNKRELQKHKLLLELVLVPCMGQLPGRPICPCDYRHLHTHWCGDEKVRWLLQPHQHVPRPKPPPLPGGWGRQLLPDILLFFSYSLFNVAHSSAVKELFLSTLICFAESMVGIFWYPFLCEDVASCHASPDNGALPNDSHWHIKHDVVMGIMYRPLLF